MRLLLAACLLLTPPLVALSDRLLDGVDFSPAISGSTYALTSGLPAAADNVAADDVAADDVAADDVAADDVAAEDVAAEDVAAEDGLPSDREGTPAQGTSESRRE